MNKNTSKLICKQVDGYIFKNIYELILLQSNTGVFDQYRARWIKFIAKLILYVFSTFFYISE